MDRTASDGAAGDAFGREVAISGDYAIVGTSGDDVGANSDQGSAYVFVREGGSWSQQAKLTASDGASGDTFGTSVAISGNFALIGSPNDDNGAITNQGSAYVYVRSGTSWTQQAKLTASDGAALDLFGSSVAISGTSALVGANSDQIGFNLYQGSAYVFVQAGLGWIQSAKLTASDGMAADYFGNSVALSGDYALVGAMSDIGANSNQGSVYVFMRGGGTWTFQTKLIGSDGAANDNFGSRVAISGDYVLVGAADDDIGAVGTGSDRGSAFVFVRSGSIWTQQARLLAPDGQNFGYFGRSVALSGDYALVGADGTGVGADLNQGAAYLFKRTGTSWILVRKITDNAPANTRNGRSVGISNNSFIIGGSGFQDTKGKVAFGTVDN